VGQADPEGTRLLPLGREARLAELRGEIVKDIIG
jgi:hypothetical protein